MSADLTIIEAIEIAILEEVKAYDLYTETSLKMNNPGSKKMLTELANQELGHKKMLENIVSNKELDKLQSKVQQGQTGISDFLVEVELNKNATPQDVLIFAMKAEEKAFKFYSDLKNHFAGTELEETFSKLANEEKNHKLKLEHEYEDNIYREN